MKKNMVFLFFALLQISYSQWVHINNGLNSSSQSLAIISNNIFVSTDTVQKFFLQATGNYWVYAKYNLDSVGNKDMSSMTTDSTVITGTQILYSKNSYIFKTYNSKTGSSTQNFYTENGKLYTEVASVIPDTTQFPLPLNIPNAWVVVADPDTASWTIFSQALNNADYPVPGYGTAKLTGIFAIRGEKGSQSTMQTGENQTISVLAQEYRMISSFNGTITIPAVPIPMTLTFAITNHSWYGVNIGLIQSKAEPLTILVGGGLITQKIQGTESDMLRYFGITSVNEKDNDNNNIQFYPNPASNNLTIEIKNNKAVNKIEIINLLGTKVIEYYSKEQRTTINIESLSEGVYFLRIGNQTTMFFNE